MPLGRFVRQTTVTNLHIRFTVGGKVILKRINLRKQQSLNSAAKTKTGKNLAVRQELQLAYKFRKLKLHSHFFALDVTDSRSMETNALIYSQPDRLLQHQIILNRRSLTAKP